MGNIFSKKKKKPIPASNTLLVSTIMDGKIDKTNDSKREKLITSRHKMENERKKLHVKQKKTLTHIEENPNNPNTATNLMSAVRDECQIRTYDSRIQKSKNNSKRLAIPPEQRKLRQATHQLTRASLGYN